jgi:hypothetical protein
VTSIFLARSSSEWGLDDGGPLSLAARRARHFDPQYKPV